jgi:2'-5' RNA ligase
MTSMAESARPWRLFWAVPLPAELRSALEGFVSRLQAAPRVEDDWRFADPAAWHITLAFLGATEPATVEPMMSRVAAALQSHEPMEVTAGGIGAFPRRGRANVLWYGISDLDGRLAALADAVRSAARLAAEEPQRPHVTLARARDRRGARLPVLAGDAPPSAQLRVGDVVLFRSHLGGGPARYEELTRATLGAASLAGASR